MCPIHELPAGVRKPGEAPDSGRIYDVERDAIAAWRAAETVFADPGADAGITQAPSPNQSAVQYPVDVHSEARTNATQAAASLRPVYIFVGGYRDDVDKNVWNYYHDEFEPKHPGQAFYYSWDAGEAIKSFIKGLPDGTPVNLIGHSWGADTAAKIAAAPDGKISTLITVDPVSRPLPGFAAVRSHTKVWIDVNAKPTDHSNLSNIVAGFGGDWGNGPNGAATTYIEAVENHAEFTKMMRTEGPDGRTPEQMLLGR